MFLLILKYILEIIVGLIILAFGLIIIQILFVGIVFALGAYYNQKSMRK